VNCAQLRRTEIRRGSDLDLVGAAASQRTVPIQPQEGPRAPRDPLESPVKVSTRGLVEPVPAKLIVESEFTASVVKF
jgi:hypothetical protein